MARARVGHALCVAVNLEDFPAVRALAEAHAALHATVGVHPDHRDGAQATVEEIVRLADHPRVVAIGETGLDYHRGAQDAELQRSRFRIHIRAARGAGKPLVVHSRDAEEDTLRILGEEGAGQVGGVLHCFTGSAGMAQQAMEMGFLISFSGIVTFRNAAALREVARQVPLERMLIETDAPYLAPVPHRGKTNEPAFVALVGEELARLKGVEAAELGRQTSANFYRLFRIPETRS
ncbi:MAG: TatD family hydrolase [Rhodocyclaceae bacterium]